MNLKKIKKDLEKNEKDINLGEALSLNIDSIMSKMKTNRKLQEFDTAESKRMNECNNCGACCWKMPCSYTFEEIKIVADYLKISERHFFMQYLTINPYTQFEYDIVNVRHHQNCNGNVLPQSEFGTIKSPCVFYENNKCFIHKVKPQSAKLFKCWKHEDIEFKKYNKEQILNYLESIK